MKLIKLIKNELMKIFKRKSIYILFFISFVAILFYQFINPDQNAKIKGNETVDKDIALLENSLERIKSTNGSKTEAKNQGSTDNIESQLQNFLQELNQENQLRLQYKETKTELDFANLYNQYSQNSWQRYALNEENQTTVIGKNEVNDNHIIMKCLSSINDYEMDNESTISLAEYQKAKEQYREYEKALEDNDWQKFVRLKIDELMQLQKDSNLSLEKKEFINIQIDTYQLRLTNQIPYTDDLLNQYLQEYQEKSCFLVYDLTVEREDAQYKQEIEQLRANIALSKYAIENKINQDISPAEFNLTVNNQVDARNCFIRTFHHFDLIIVIIAIYIACTIVTEEVNQGTIKNLVTKPHKRSTILLSKVITCLIVTLIAMLFVTISQFLVGGLVFGFDSYSLSFIGYDYSTSQVFTMNLFHYIVLVGLTKLPMYFFIIVFCLWIGIINNHTSMSIIVTLILFLVFSTIISEWSKNVRFSVLAKYVITNNWDFSSYLFGQVSNINGLTLSVSIVIYLVYLLVFLGAGIYQFNHKEINNK